MPHHIRDLHPRPRSASSEDDNSDESSESESNAPQFFSAEANNPSAEPDEMDSGDDNDDAKNKGGQVNTTGQEMSKSHPPLQRSTQRRRPPSSCHLCDQEIREECRREDDLPHVAKQAYLCPVCKMSATPEREKTKKKHGHPNTSI